MPMQELTANLQEFLQGRHIATIATENADGSIHMTAVWYIFEDGRLYIATSSKTKKARNLAARPKASLMIDSRKPGKERGVTAAGRVELISGRESQEINYRIHSRYLSAAALADAGIGPVFAAFDDVTIRLTPASWTLVGHGGTGWPGVRGPAGWNTRVHAADGLRRVQTRYCRVLTFHTLPRTFSFPAA